MTIQENLKELNDLFSIFDNTKDKFVQLMDMAIESEGLNELERVEENKIYGCTSQAWVLGSRNENNTYVFRTDSDAMIVKGLLSLLERIFNNQIPKDILSVNCNDILSSVGLDGAVTSQRTNGFFSAIQKIQEIVK
ncbi:MAG: hypothetical protein CMG57_04215 [Candidatus Marinimicrobia bacterium]|nr:hypothetical protein [Candidatus Neomarinimicrobiota bacterium]|tara:strand:- start:1790 stop:2197 length:408 start_codon:yes stop_codon:yes gene_type:complete